MKNNNVSNNTNKSTGKICVLVLIFAVMFAAACVAALYIIPGKKIPADLKAEDMTTSKLAAASAKTITLDKLSVMLEVGDVEHLTATLHPQNAEDIITWESKNPEIASVTDNGIVTAVSEGYSTIIVTDKESNLSAQCQVIVANEVFPETVTPASESIFITKGDTKEIKYSVAPENAKTSMIYFESNNPNIAKVTHDGKITAVDCGDTVITIKDRKNPAVFAMVNITVTAKATGITMSSSSEQISKGDGVQLSCKSTPEGIAVNNIIWESSDTDVATVSNGYVKGISVGSCTITAKTTDKKFTATCNITVNEKARIMNLNTDEIKFEKLDDVKNLSVTWFPDNSANNKIIWRSSNDAIATVSNDGKVMSLGYGDCVITATCQNNPSLYDTCTVFVYTKVKEIELSETELEMAVGDEEKITCKVRPASADQEVEWKTSNKKVATVDSRGRIKAVGEGSCTITCKSESGGVSETCSVTVEE